MFQQDPHSHCGGINWVVLSVHSFETSDFFGHQVEQRVTHLLLTDANDWVSHGEHFDDVRRNPANGN